MKQLLVSAYGCWPGKGSELGVGWEWCKQMAKNNQLHIITIKRCKDDIETACKRLDNKVAKNMTFHYCDYSLRLIKLLPAGTVRWYLYYTLWQLRALNVARKLKEKHHLDYVMHLTFGSVWLPTFMYKLGIPYIWGPWGGCDVIPNSFLKEVNPKASSLLSWMQSKREWLVNHISWNPLIKANFKKSVAILVRTQANYNAIPQQYRNKGAIILETALLLPLIDLTDDYSNSIRILNTGRLIPTKNLPMAIKAVAFLLRKYNVTFDIIGGGPDKDSLKGLISSLGVENSIHILEPMQRDLLLKRIPLYDIYLFPSLLEGGSWALMEAMGCGLPTVCFDAAGMGVIADDSCAIKIPMNNPEEALHDMTDALEKLCADSLLRKKMGKNAALRIKDKFNWDSKGIFMEKLFQKLENNYDTR